MMNTLNVKEFSLADTLGCGQSFSWAKEGNGYVNADLGQVVYIEQRGQRLLFETSMDCDVDIQSLLGLNDPINRIRSNLARDDIMRQSMAFAPGLRIVRDPFFSCLISFICSIWKNIPAIQLSMDRIRRQWGPEYSFRGMTYYGMPSPEAFAEASIEELRELGLGFRAKYIKKTAEAIATGFIDTDALQDLTYEEARRELKSLHGVGDKVADCVCLFSLGRLEAFPIDIWIERVIEQHYGIFAHTGNSYSRKSAAARAYFGEYAGYAQEYLYHYARSRGRNPCPS
jgi:N-glycosylase/DNA lyase